MLGEAQVHLTRPAVLGVPWFPVPAGPPRAAGLAERPTLRSSARLGCPPRLRVLPPLAPCSCPPRLRVLPTPLQAHRQVKDQDIHHSLPSVPQLTLNMPSFIPVPSPTFPHDHHPRHLWHSKRERHGFSYVPSERSNWPRDNCATTTTPFKYSLLAYIGLALHCIHGRCTKPRPDFQNH